MGQVHFLGLEINARSVTAVLLGRDRSVIAAGTQPIAPDNEDDDGCLAEPRKWVRLVADAVRELVDSSGIPTSKIWGVAPAAPPGWVALDADWSPLTELRLANERGRERIPAELTGFLDAHPRNRSRLALILPPKDFLRFALSQIIATDAGDAACLGLLRPGTSDWDGERLAALDIDPRWLPPILPAAFACGRIGPRGMEAMGLADTAWSTVGSTLVPALMLGCGYLDTPAVHLFARQPARAYWYGTPRPDAEAQPGFAPPTHILGADRERLPADVFTNDTPVILDWREGEDPAALIEWARTTGRPVYAAPYAGKASPGPAIMAALASRAFTDREAFFRRFAAPTPI